MINTGNGGIEFLLIFGVIAVMAAGYYWLVVVPMRRDDDVEDWDELEE
jgi:hypothetical protein